MQERPKTIDVITEGVTRIIAPNPSPMTYWGTNSFLLGTGKSRVLIDPGPESAAHVEAILSALPDGGDISMILVTHGHLDHSGATRQLKEKTGAEVIAFGDINKGRRPVMQSLIETGYTGGGEGVDPDFYFDRTCADKETLGTPAGAITALHTPGHMTNHLSFLWQNGAEKHIFCGDLIMEWSSSLISPPDGDARAFRDSCLALKALAPDILWPAHGHGIGVKTAGVDLQTPSQRINSLLDHRQSREDQILSALEKGPATLPDITRAVYTDIPQSLIPLAERNSFAHLIDLTEQDRVRAAPTFSEKSLFSIT